MKRRIAVLGGGAASLATAFELTRRAGHRDRFEITVYQMGHRLGGKGASGVNRARHDRIEEHGLHIFWGFYENAFRLMRETYAELGRAPSAPLATFEDAFMRQDLIVVPERDAAGTVSLWPLRMPRNERLPGDGLEDGLDPWDSVPRIFGKTLEIMGIGEVNDAGLAAKMRPLVERAMSGGARAFDALEAAVRSTTQALFESWIHTHRLARSLLPIAGGLAVARAMATSNNAVVESRAHSVLFIVRHVARAFDRLVDSGETDARLRVQIDLGLTLARGLLVDRLVVAPRDFHALDDESLREWLRRHGAREETIASPLLEALHSAIYSSGLEMAAGTAVHGLLRIAFTYKGSILWKMRAGMGETIFAPLYEVLRRRGVRFEFFHAVRRLDLSSDKQRIAAVQMEVQAETRSATYSPLIDVRGLPAWPSEPLWDELVDGADLRASGVDFESWWKDNPRGRAATLEYGRDFDEVVLGISLGALRDICPDLCADGENPRFGAMVENVRTTPTQSAQLWMSPSMAALGHDPNDPPVVIPFTQPMDTWADMSHLLARESWPAELAPGSCAYLTARLVDEEPVPPRGPCDYADRIRARVVTNTARWLKESAGVLWPGAGSTHDPNELRWHLLVDPDERDGEARLEAQWFAPVSNPSDRYVLSIPGTTKHRLRSHESGYDNLVLAGDWTRNSINGGCVESAVMSGMDAARTLDGGVRPAIGDWLATLEASRARPSVRPSASAERAPLPRSTPTRPPPAVSPQSSRDLPRYVVRDGELLAVPPVEIEVDVSMFALRADMTKLEALVDRLLNHQPEKATYRALAPLAVLYCARVDNHAVTDPLGFVPELDFGFWIPVLGGRTVEGRFVADRLVTLTPYLWVSNDVALNNGRSIFGFFKDLGTRMTFPDAHAPDRPFSVSAWVLPRMGRESPIEERPLLEVRKTGTSTSARRLADLGHVMGSIVGSVAGGGEGSLDALRAGLAMARAAPRGQRMVFLKQFPDALDARRACYQAVVECDIRFTSEPQAEVLEPRHEISLYEYDSHHVVSTLGLATERGRDRDHVTTSLAAGRARFRAAVESPSIIWERGPRQ
jgi:uncharacterized protein with NAD-binding domain and iron-sulfur cluster